MIVQAVVSFFHVQSSIPFTLIVVLISPPLQDWLASSARKVGLAGRPMEWLTPLGLPVVQPYHKPSSKVVSTPKMCEIVCWCTVGIIILLPYSQKIWQFGSLYYNCQIKIRQNFLLACIRMAILYQTAKFKFANILAIAILGSTAKFNSRQYFRLYSIRCMCTWWMSISCDTNQ